MNVVRRIALCLLGGLALLVGVVSPAAAADELGISSDGVTWADSLSGPLFEPTFRWVPGDSETRTFYVRNQSTDAALLDVTLVTGPVEDLIDSGDLTVGVSVDSGPFASATTGGEHRLINRVPVAPGTVHRVDVQVDFDPASTNETQEQVLDLHFDVTLSQDGSVSPPDGDGDGDGDGGGVSGPGGELPGTGSVVSPALLLTAALLCATGFGLVGRARRSRNTNERQNSHA